MKRTFALLFLAGTLVLFQPAGQAMAMQSNAQEVASPQPKPKSRSSSHNHSHHGNKTTHHKAHHKASRKH